MGGRHNFQSRRGPPSEMSGCGGSHQEFFVEDLLDLSHDPLQKNPRPLADLKIIFFRATALHTPALSVKDMGAAKIIEAAFSGGSKPWIASNVPKAKGSTIPILPWVIYTTADLSLLYYD